MAIILRIVKRIKDNFIIILTLVILNFTLLLLAVLGNAILQNEVYDKNVEKGISKCSETANALDNIVFYGENIVNFVERDYRLMSNLKNTNFTTQDLVTETFDMISKNTDYFSNLYIASDGQVISTLDSKYENSAITGREWYENALAKGDIIITNPYNDLLTNKAAITISKKVDSKDDSVVALDIKQEEINRILQKEIEFEDSVYLGLIINNDGVIVGHIESEYIGLAITDERLENHIEIKSFVEEILQNDSGQIKYDRGNNAYSIVHKKTESDWHVIYVINKKILNHTTFIYRERLLIVFSICFILLNLVILIYYIKRQRAIKLKDRAENAEKVLIEYKNDLESLIEEKTESIRIQSEKLKELNISIIENLADIVEFRDLESGQHIKRIKKITYLLAEKAIELYPEYGIYKNKIDKICNASALHDIGKIGIPDSILLKPSKLTFEEFEDMKKHTLIGDDLVTRILEKYDEDLERYGHEICRYHHERYDGKGYPDGLKGDEIPFSAQIVGIADVYDALTEKRVYKDAYSHEKAINMIKNGECGVFSNKLLHCLELVENDLLLVSKTY